MVFYFFDSREEHKYNNLIIKAKVKAMKFYIKKRFKASINSTTLP